MSNQEQEIKMINELLKLESGQILKVLPISKNRLYFDVTLYHIAYIKKFFIDDDIHQHFKMEWKEWKDKIYRQNRYYTIVDYKNELKLICFGRKIKEKLDGRYNDNFDLLQVVVENVSGYSSYNKCEILNNSNNDSKYNNLDLYFESDDYKNLISVYNKWYNSLQLKNNSNLSKYLLDKGFINQDYTSLFRNIKLKKLQKLINRRKSINQLLNNHLGIEHDYTELVDAIEEWYKNEFIK